MAKRKKEQNISNSYYSPSNEGKAAGRKSIKVVSAPEFPKGAVFESIDDDKRIFGKDPEHTFVEINDVPDYETSGFQVVGPEYFENTDLLPEEVREIANTDFDSEISVQVIEDENLSLPEVEILFSEGAAHAVTEDQLFASSTYSTEVEEVMEFVSVIDPEDVGFSPLKIKKIPKGEESQNKFWRRIKWQIHRRNARLNKEKIIVAASRNYINETLSAVDHDGKYEKWYDIFPEEVNFAL